MPGRYMGMLIVPSGVNANSGAGTYYGSSGYPTSSISSSHQRYLSGGLPALASTDLTAIAELDENTAYHAVLYGAFYLMGFSPYSNFPISNVNTGSPPSGTERGFGNTTITVHGFSV